MITLTADQQTIVDAASKKTAWKFTVIDTTPVTYYWAQRVIDDGTSAYAAKIIAGSFAGIKMRGSASNMGLVAPSDTSFRVADADEDYDPDDFIGGSVLITLQGETDALMEDICSWKFKITHAEHYEGELTIECEDFLADVLRADYPNDPLVDSLFPSTNRPKPGTRENGGYGDMTVPRGYGTYYVPCAPVYLPAPDDVTYYLVGQGSATADYTVSAIHSPAERAEAEYTTPGTTINKYVKASGGVDYVVAEPLIALGGTVVGFWQDGDWMLPAPIQVAYSGTSAITGPEDVIEHFLKALGVSAGDIDTATTFTAAGVIYAGWSLAYAGAFWRKVSRQAALASLLWPANSYLLVGEDVELHVFSKTSVATLSDDDLAIGTFRQTAKRKDTADSGQTSYIPASTPMDRFKTITVTAKTTTAAPSGRTLENLWVRDTQDVQRAATLALQRELYASYDLDIETGYSQIALRPEDVVTINFSRFAASFAARISEMHITEADGIKFTLTRYSVALDDWSDLAPGAVTVSTSTTSAYQPISYGPAPDTPASGTPANHVIGDIVLAADGKIYTVGKDTFGDATAGIFLGYDATETAYCFDIGDANSYLRWDGGALSVRMASGETFDLYGNLKVYEGGDITLLQGAGLETSKIIWAESDGTTYAELFSYEVAGNFNTRITGVTDGVIKLWLGSNGVQFKAIAAYSVEEVDITNTPSGAGNVSRLYLTSENTYISDGATKIKLDGTLDKLTVTAGNSEFSGDITMADDQWIGLGAAKGRLLWDDTTIDEALFLDCRVGIGGDIVPDSLLHIHNATAGAVTAVAGTLLTIENNGDAYLTFLTPTSNVSGFAFGDTDLNVAASFYYDHNASSFTWRVENTSELKLGNTALYPYSDAGLDLGTSTRDWKDIYFSGSLKQSGAVAGALDRWVYQNDTLADDATVDLPDAIDGFGFVQCGAEGMLFTAAADGSVVKISGSANTAATDSDTALCVFDNGTAARIRNRLGSAQVTRAWFVYQ